MDRGLTEAAERVFRQLAQDAGQCADVSRLSRDTEGAAVQFKKPGLTKQRYCLKAPLHLGQIETLITFPTRR